MTDHKVSDFVTKKSYHAVTLVSKYLVKATSDTVWVNSAVPAIHYCWAQMCLNMSYVFIHQYYLRHHAAIHQANAIQGWVQPSSTQTPQDVSYIYDWGGLIHKIPWKTGLTYESLCGKYILSMLKTKYDQPKFCLMATQVVLLQKNNSHLRSKKSSGSNSSYLKEAT